MSDLLRKLNGPIAKELAKVLAEELAAIELPEGLAGGDEQ